GAAAGSAFSAAFGFGGTFSAIASLGAAFGAASFAAVVAASFAGVGGGGGGGTTVAAAFVPGAAADVFRFGSGEIATRPRASPFGTRTVGSGGDGIGVTERIFSASGPCTGTGATRATFGGSSGAGGGSTGFGAGGANTSGAEAGRVTLAAFDDTGV